MFINKIKPNYVLSIKICILSVPYDLTKVAIYCVYY